MIILKRLCIAAAVLLVGYAAASADTASDDLAKDVGNVVALKSICDNIEFDGPGLHRAIASSGLGHAEFTEKGGAYYRVVDGTRREVVLSVAGDRAKTEALCAAGWAFYGPDGVRRRGMIRRP